jgi:hypothetical protein
MQFVMIQGKKGVGKTCLARTLRTPADAMGGYFVATRSKTFFHSIFRVGMCDTGLDPSGSGSRSCGGRRSPLVVPFQPDIEPDDIEMPCLSLVIVHPKDLSDESGS